MRPQGWNRGNREKGAMHPRGVGEGSHGVEFVLFWDEETDATVYLVPTTVQVL